MNSWIQISKNLMWIHSPGVGVGKGAMETTSPGLAEKIEVFLKN